MVHRLLGVVSLALPLFGCQSSPHPVESALATIQAEDLRAYLGFLASAELEGRESATRGGRIAAAYIASQFRAYGLESAGGEGYFQPFPIIRYRPDVRASRLEIRGRFGERLRVLEWGRDYLGRYARELDLEAPVAFAGYGITAPDLGYDDYDGLEALGKVVLVFDHEPQEVDPASPFSGTLLTRHASGRAKVLNAQAHGALAVLVAGEPRRDHPSNLDRISAIPGILDRLAEQAAQALVADEVQIPSFLVSDEVVAQLLAPTGEEPSQLQEGIDREFLPRSMDIPGRFLLIRVRHASAETTSTRNVIAMVRGRDEILSDQAALITAHYDHDGLRDGTIYHGADDDASGTSVLLEVAQAYAQSALSPRRSVVFAAFGAEEKGLLGSYHYVTHPAVPLSRTVGVINLDMVGRRAVARNEQEEAFLEGVEETDPVFVLGVPHAPELWPLVEERAREVGLVVDRRFERERILNAFQRSDHWPFAQRHIPVLFFTTGLHPDYHQPTDSAEKIDYEKLSRVARLTLLLSLDLANTDQPALFLPYPPAEAREP